MGGGLNLLEERLLGSWAAGLMQVLVLVEGGLFGFRHSEERLEAPGFIPAQWVAGGMCWRILNPISRRQSGMPLAEKMRAGKQDCVLSLSEETGEEGMHVKRDMSAER